MIRKNKILIALIVFTSLLFLHKPLSGKIPFPGDLLISEYNPWKSEKYLGYNPGSYPSKAQYFDVARQLYPWKTFVIESIKNGHFPLWNPYNFSGQPLFANSQSQVLYPLNIVFFIFDQKIAWTIFLYLQFAGSGLFMYLYTRKIGLSKIASLFSSIAYTFSLYATVFFQYANIGHTILWLPALLYIVERIRDHKHAIDLFLYALCIPIVLFAGHLQLFFLTILFSSLYAVYRLYSSSSRKTFIFFIAANLIGFLLASVQLLPTFELIENAARTSHERSFLSNNLLVSLHQFVLIFSPDFFGNPATRNFTLSTSYPTKAMYIGLAPLLFAAVSLYQIRKNTYIRFFSITSILVIFLISNNPITASLYTSSIPFLSSSSPSNAIFLLSFSLAVLGGLGLHYWKKNTIKVNKKIVLAPLTFALLVGSSFFLKNDFSNKNLMYSTVLFTLFASILILAKKLPSKKALLSIAIVVVTILDLFYFFQKFNPFVEKEIVFPQHHVFKELKNISFINRFWSYASADIEANYATQYSLYDANGYDPLYPKWYGEFIGASKDGALIKEFNRSNRSDAVIAKSSSEKDFLQNSFRKKVIDTLGIKYVLDKSENASTEETFPEEVYKKIYDQKGWKVLENKTTLPRAYLAYNYKTYSSKEKFEKLFFDQSLNPQETILLEKKPDIQLGKTPEKKPQITVTKHSATEIDIVGKTSENALLFLSDTYYPGWTANVNGKREEVLKAHYALKAIEIPKGTFAVSLTYHPRSFSLGIKISIMSLCLLFVTYFLLKRYEFKKN